MKIIVRVPAEDDFLAELTDIAYRALLRQGLTRSFVDVELELWSDIRDALRDVGDRDRPSPQLALNAY